MEEFRIFISKLHNSLSESLLPVIILHSQQNSDVVLKDISESGFRRGKTSDFFKLVKESNGQVIVVNQLREVG